MHGQTTPVRLSIHTRRYEAAISLFDSFFDGDGPHAPTPATPDEERSLGIYPFGGDGDFFVKPADPTLLRPLKDGKRAENIEEMDIITEARMSVLPDPTTPGAETVVILYEETEISGMEGTTSTITYRTDDPGLVTMLRSGTVKTALSFRAHHRTLCIYDTPYMPFSVGIHAITVDNRLLSDGLLILDYLIEIKGGVAERCTMTISMKA